MTIAAFAIYVLTVFTISVTYLYFKVLVTIFETFYFVALSVILYCSHFYAYSCLSESLQMGLFIFETLPLQHLQLTFLYFKVTIFETFYVVALSVIFSCSHFYVYSCLSESFQMGLFIFETLSLQHLQFMSSSFSHPSFTCLYFKVLKSLFLKFLFFVCMSSVSAVSNILVYSNPFEWATLSLRHDNCSIF
jgi:hypothetical protein